MESSSAHKSIGFHRKQSRQPLSWVTVVSYIVMFLMSMCCILPFVLLFMSSITEETTLTIYGYSFFPKEFSFDAFHYLAQNAAYIGRAYGLTIVVTVIGTAAHLIMAMLLGYTLSREDLPGRKVLNFLLVFAMLFNGGLVPTYLIYTETFHIKNTIFAQLVPNLMLNVFDIFLARNYFTNSVPNSILEAARIDGASEFTTFWRIALPLSIPIAATIGLFAGVAYWNDWQNGLYYVTDNSLYNIQNVLNSMLRNIQFLKNSSETAAAAAALPSNSVRMAIAVVAVLPILVVYPFFQKYFVKGIVVGGVKG